MSPVFSAAELACFPPPHHHPPCFLNLPGPQVHGPSTNSRDLPTLVKGWQATLHCALVQQCLFPGLCNCRHGSSFHRPTQLSTIDISPNANVTARCVFCRAESRSC